MEKENTSKTISAKIEVEGVDKTIEKLQIIKSLLTDIKGLVSDIFSEQMKN